MELIDNISKTLKEDLTAVLRKGSRVDIAASRFSIYAFEELKSQLKSIDKFRFIFTSPAFISALADKQKREFYIPRLNRERSLYGSEFEIRLRNDLTQHVKAKECAAWIKKKGSFKSNISEKMMGGFAVVDETVYTPLSSFTSVELGCVRGDNVYTMINKIDGSYAQQYATLFEQLWNDNNNVADVTDKVIDCISAVFKENSPEFIYFLTLYHIFHEFLDDLSEDELPDEATGFKESRIWSKLFNYQKDACLAIINKLEKYNGCILADSVGLGKTFTALAVIKYYENRNKSVLVLCPKKLSDNWLTYKSNYLNNPIAADRLRYDVLFHSDLSRSGGKSNGLDLSFINWGNYDLVVIDESHNFRNGGKVSTDAGGKKHNNRYLQLLDRVLRSGVKTKVLMLSATPVNNRFNDLKNQIQLACEGKTEQLDKLLHTSTKLDEIFRQAQKAYNVWSKLPASQRSTKELLNRLNFDFFEVLDSVTIARSRRHIQKYYDTADIGSFPERLPPLTRTPDLTSLDAAVTYNDIYSILESLNLAVYTPSDFILPSRIGRYRNIDADQDAFFGHGASGRERGIRRLMSINLLKRLESSVNSFRLTLGRIKSLISDTLDKLDHADKSAVIDTAVISDQGFDYDDRESDVFLGSKKTQISLDDIDHISWRRYLEADVSLLDRLLGMLADISPDCDSKLQQLLVDLQHKFEHPINPGNRKVIIFTAFSDTAEYLYDNLSRRIKDQFGLNTALVTGDVEARSTLRLPRREKLDFNKVLTLFSPQSKDKKLLYPQLQAEIDVLIATDCISEGQNLQDCDFLINYDIHWNPVRIIQRFGRIDRIGSGNKVIQLVNYWPNVTLDTYIGLKGRVEARMKVSVMTSTGDDNPLSPEEQGDLEYRREQLKRLRQEVVDLEEMNAGVSIMDLGLNEFRLDLMTFLKKHQQAELSPLGLHAVVPAGQNCPPGVIFVLKNRCSEVKLDYKNRLHPFYMVYISEDQEVVVNHMSPKELLDRFRSLCSRRSSPDPQACRKFNQLTHDGKNMRHYSAMLNVAIESIVNIKEQNDIDGFLSGAAEAMRSGCIRGLDDFELICFLVVE